MSFAFIFMTDKQTVRFVKGRVCVCVSWGWTYVSVCVCWWEVAHVLAAGVSVDLHLIITADRTSFFSLCPWPTNCDTQTLKNTPASHSSNSAEAIEELLCLVLNLTHISSTRSQSSLVLKPEWSLRSCEVEERVLVLYWILARFSFKVECSFNNLTKTLHTLFMEAFSWTFI